MTTLVGGGTIPVGAILPFAGPISELPPGFLLCDGSEINRNDFSALFGVIDEYWGDGDASLTFNLPTTQGLQLRGQANGSGNDEDRASRTALLGSPNSGDNVGSFQNDRFESHRHSSYIRNSDSGHNSTNGTTVNTGNINGETRGSFGNSSPITVNRASWGARDGSNSGPSGGSSVIGLNGNINANDTSPNSAFEYSFQSYYLNTNNNGSAQTVGKNVYVNFIIKY